MTKYSRFDPRNKKRGKQKVKSIEKDLRIREVIDNNSKRLLKEVMYDEQHDHDDLDNQQLHG
ncbi:hypothetical protein N9Y60_03585 [Crocinitomicaceae bacterium]|nr:hypothetical protein [Crocinitomicaceae bacterium]